MSEACPDCKGTGVYRGLLREGPCPTCTAAIENVIRAGDMIAGVGTALPSPTCTCKGPEGQPHKPGCPHYNQHLWNTLAQELAHSANRSAKCIRPSAEVEADYGLRPGSLAPRPEPLAAGMLDQEIAQPDEVIRELQRENVWSPEMTEAIDAAEQVLDKQPGRMTVGKMLQLLIEKGRIKYEPAADVERKFALPPGTLVECTQPLEPVAQDADGQIKPIDEMFPDSAGWIGLARLGGGEAVESTDHHEIETIIRGSSRAGKSWPEGPVNVPERIAAIPHGPGRNVIARAWIAQQRDLVDLWEHRLEDCDSESAKSVYREAIDATKQAVEWLLREIT